MLETHILILKLSAFVFLLGVLTNCTSVGPRSINASRTAYAEAIDQTENEQLLLMIVKGRYGETASLLAVNAVAANIKFRSEGGIAPNHEYPYRFPINLKGISDALFQHF